MKALYDHYGKNQDLLMNRLDHWTEDKKANLLKARKQICSYLKLAAVKNSLIPLYGILIRQSVFNVFLVDNAGEEVEMVQENKSVLDELSEVLCPITIAAKNME